MGFKADTGASVRGMKKSAGRQSPEYSKAYYEANKEAIIARQKAYYAVNKEKAKAYYEANKEKLKAYQKLRMQKPGMKEKMKAYQKDYQADPEIREKLRVYRAERYESRLPPEAQRWRKIKKMINTPSEKILGPEVHPTARELIDSVTEEDMKEFDEPVKSSTIEEPVAAPLELLEPPLEEKKDSKEEPKEELE